jgi:hypothetical protein
MVLIFKTSETMVKSQAYPRAFPRDPTLNPRRPMAMSERPTKMPPAVALFEKKTTKNVK